MKQSQKLDALIKSVLEEEEEYITSTGTASSATGPQKLAISKKKPGSIVRFRKPGTATTTGGALEENEEGMDQKQSGTDIAGQVAEIVEKLKIMSEGDKDPKKQKLASKVMKYMESAKAALEALTGHEAMLEEKGQKAREDDATKQLRGVRKQLDKILKDKEIADRVMEKMSVDKMIDLKSKAKKDIDEAGLARIMVKHSLMKEGWALKYK